MTDSEKTVRQYKQTVLTAAKAAKQAHDQKNQKEVADRNRQYEAIIKGPAVTLEQIKQEDRERKEKLRLEQIKRRQSYEEKHGKPAKRAKKEQDDDDEDDDGEGEEEGEDEEDAQDDEEDDEEEEEEPSKEQYSIAAVWRLNNDKVFVHWFGFDNLSEMTVEPLLGAFKIVLDQQTDDIKKKYPWKTGEEAIALQKKYPDKSICYQLSD